MNKYLIKKTITTIYKIKMIIKLLQMYKHNKINMTMNQHRS